MTEYIDIPDAVRNKVVNLSLVNAVFYPGMLLEGELKSENMLVFTGPISGGTMGLIYVRTSHITSIEIWP